VKEWEFGDGARSNLVRHDAANKFSARSDIERRHLEDENSPATDKMGRKKSVNRGQALFFYPEWFAHNGFTNNPSMFIPICLAPRVLNGY
jgi:hypothetical protein